MRARRPHALTFIVGAALTVAPDAAAALVVGAADDA